MRAAAGLCTLDVLIQWCSPYHSSESEKGTVYRYHHFNKLFLRGKRYGWTCTGWWHSRGEKSMRKYVERMGDEEKSWFQPWRHWSSIFEMQMVRVQLTPSLKPYGNIQFFTPLLCMPIFFAFRRLCKNTNLAWVGSVYSNTLLASYVVLLCVVRWSAIMIITKTQCASRKEAWILTTWLTTALWPPHPNLWPTGQSACTLFQEVQLNVLLGTIRD